MTAPIKIALPPDHELPVPLLHYGDIERIIGMLARRLVERGNEARLSAHSDSAKSMRLTRRKRLEEFWCDKAVVGAYEELYRQRAGGKCIAMGLK